MKSDSEIGRKLYDPLLSYRPALIDDSNKLRDATGMSAEDAERRLAAVAEVCDDANLTMATARRLHGLLVRNTIAPPDDGTVQGWATETRTRVRERHGELADWKLEQVRSFVDARPQFAELLNTTGLGSHHELVEALIETANHASMEPRER